MAIVAVDDSCLKQADSQPKIRWLGLRVGGRLALSFHQMNRVNSRNDLCYDDSTINIVVVIIIIIIIIIKLTGDNDQCTCVCSNCSCCLQHRSTCPCHRSSVELFHCSERRYSPCCCRWQFSLLCFCCTAVICSFTELESETEMSTFALTRTKTKTEIISETETK